jgi:hypothetical protein
MNTMNNLLTLLREFRPDGPEKLFELIRQHVPTATSDQVRRALLTTAYDQKERAAELMLEAGKLELLADYFLALAPLYGGGRDE